MKKMLLPHVNERKTPVEMLVLHATAHNSEDAVKCLNENELSCHYVVGQKGEIIQVADEDKRAWHAGVAYWRGVDSDLNSRSIGIEVCSMSLGQEAFAEEQIKSLIALCQGIIKRYSINAKNVVGHSDIAPLRKPDPGFAFPWQRLSQEGIGLWYDNNLMLKENDITILLKTIGYDTRSSGVVRASAYAFCRHFLPEYVQKIDDVSYLVENVLPSDFSFMKEDKFLKVLKAVAFAYK